MFLSHISLISIFCHFKIIFLFFASHSGVFVRIKEKNLHVECFKCATCGTSLKNVGYYNINNKLYCDVHAKMVARQNPPGPGLEPVTVPL